MALLVNAALLSSRANAQASAPQGATISNPPTSAPRCILPSASWVSNFFGGTDGIDDRASKSNLRSLRRYIVPDGDVELRFWEGFGLTYLEGIQFTRTNGVWAGKWLYGVPPKFGKTPFIKLLPPPRSGWDAFWMRLNAEGIMTLPDASELPKDNITVFDGMSYVVEINQDNIYRTYYYENPRSHHQPEDLNIERIVHYIETEFALPQAREKLYHYKPRNGRPVNRSAYLRE